jgi:oxygen-independent coproporphyrinogen-3 oxidase
MVSGIYIHIPFCIRKCPYCGFNSIPYDNSLAETYIDSIHKELKDYQVFDFNEVKTIYIGGGTPTVLELDPLDTLLSNMGEVTGGISLTEYTMEANPGTLNIEKLKVLTQHNLTRVSLGVQSFNGDTLKTLGRVHSPEEALLAIDQIRQAGFNNLNIDLMFAVPGQTFAQWQQDLAQATGLKPGHISLSAGDLVLPEEGEYARQYEYACDFLQQEGFQQYEISNFARPGFQCQHNLNYWNHSEYLGLGAGAHSFVQGRRWWNTSNVDSYNKKLQEGKKPVERAETLSPEEIRREFIFLSLRTRTGLSLRTFRQRFNRDFLTDYKKTVDTLVSLNHLQVQNDRVLLTRQGLLVSDSVFAEFM